MGTRESCLAMLQNAQDVLSGQEMANALGVSRCAVWKTVEALKQEGYRIVTSHKGYRLQNHTPLTKEGVASLLVGKAKDCDIAVYDCLTSTNAWQKQAGEAGKAAPSVVIARAQTAGRGRMGRSFFSPDGTGLYVSLLLRPDFDISQSLYLTTCCAVCVAEAIEAVCGKTAGIKWVNDIFVDGKKACGILTEASVDMENNKLHYAVVGIGVNVAPPKDGFPPELASIATPLWETQEEAKPAELCAAILNRFFAYLEDFSARAFLADYRRRSILIGKSVTYPWQGKTETAKVLDIGDDASLVLQAEDEIRRLQCGEVSVRLDDGGQNA